MPLSPVHVMSLETRLYRFGEGDQIWDRFVCVGVGVCVCVRRWCGLSNLQSDRTNRATPRCWRGRKLDQMYRRCALYAGKLMMPSRYISPPGLSIIHFQAGALQQYSLPQTNSDQLYLNVIPPTSLTVYEMQPAD